MLPTTEVVYDAFLDRFCSEADSKPGVSEGAHQEAQFVITLALLTQLGDQVDLTLDAVIPAEGVHRLGSFDYGV